MKKVLVLGNQGMLGHMTQSYFESLNQYEVVGLNRNDLDMFDFTKLDHEIMDSKADYVVNCVGILNNNSSHDLYANGNIALPKILQHLAIRDKRWKLIHISTNCVYSDIGPHKVDEVLNAKDMYGISKGLGEIIDDYNLTIRCSIIGPELKDGSGLMNQVLRGRVAKGYDNIMWNGITTFELAKFIEKTLDLNGILNFHGETVNKYDLCEKINTVWKTGYDLERTQGNMHQSLLEGHKSSLNLEEQLMELKNYESSNIK